MELSVVPARDRSTKTMAALKQEESLLARCEIPIIDLAHIGESHLNLHLSLSYIHINLPNSLLT